MTLISGIGFRFKNTFYSLVLWLFSGTVVYSQRTPIITWLTDLVTGSPVEGITGWQLNEWFPMFILAPVTAAIAFGFYSFRVWNHNRDAPADLTQNTLIVNENIQLLRGEIKVLTGYMKNFMESMNPYITKNGVEFRVDRVGASQVAYESEAKMKKDAKKLKFQEEKEQRLTDEIEALRRSRGVYIKENRTTATSESTDGES